MMGKFCYHLIVILISRVYANFGCKFVAFCFRRFRGKPFTLKDETHWHTVGKFSSEFKTNKNFDMTWPARSLDFIVTENVCLAVKLKLHIETDVIKTRAELVTAACRIC